MNAVGGQMFKLGRLNRLMCGGLLAASLVITGCANLPTVDNNNSEAVQVAEVNVGASPDGSIRFDTEDPRIAQLWSAAEQSRMEDNNDKALEYLYKALEISPQNSLMWSRAAELQLDNSEASLAENFAAKSNTFAADNAPLLHRNWLIIEHARSMRGDLLGVRSAHKKVQEYQYLR